MPEKSRLQKILASSGVASRRKAEELIAAGRVTVNGRVARLGDSAVPGKDTIALDGKPLGKSEKKIYLALHKPRGFVTTLHDERGRKCVAQLVEDVGERVYPVGRLDKDSEGLLLLTNDGPLGHRLLAPGRHVDKVYFVRVEGTLTAEDAAAFAAGMTLGDGLRCMPAGLERLPEPDTALVTLREGKYHQIKRMLACRGKPVRYLKRLSMGPLRLDEDLGPGEWRELTAEEIQALTSA